MPEEKDAIFYTVLVIPHVASLVCQRTFDTLHSLPSILPPACGGYHASLWVEFSLLPFRLEDLYLF